MPNDFTAIRNKVAALGVTTLREAMTIARSVAHDFDGAAARIGQTFEVPVPVAIAAEDVVPAATAPALTNTTQPTVQVAIDQWKMARFHLTSREVSEIMAGKTFVPLQMGEAIRTVARCVNIDLFSGYKDVYGYAGTAGTSLFNANVNGVADGRKILNKQLCPQGNRRLALSHDVYADGLKLAAFNEAYKRADAEALKKGILGELFGFGLMEDSDVPTHTSTPFTAGAVTVNGVNALGALVVSIAKITNTSPLVKGDIITISGNDYVVTADTTLIIGNTAVPIAPGLKAATAGGEAVTLKATHVVNLGYDPGAFALVARPLANDQIEGAPTLEHNTVISDPETKLPMCLSYIPGWKSSQWAVSLAWGKKVVDPRRAVRFAS